jgi:hypothetical protein
MCNFFFRDKSLSIFAAWAVPFPDPSTRNKRWKKGTRCHVGTNKRPKKWPRGTVGEIRRDIYQSRILLENCFVSEFR